MAQIWPPKKNVAFDLYFPICGNSLTAQSGAAGLDSEVSKDGAAFGDCTNEATEIGSTGIYKLTLTASEMNADVVTVQVKTTSLGTLAFTLYTVGGVWVTAGPGALNRTIGVTVADNPLEGASVWLSTDSAGNNVIAGPLTTSSLGIVTVLVDAGGVLRLGTEGRLQRDLRAGDHGELEAAVCVMARRPSPRLDPSALLGRARPVAPRLASSAFVAFGERVVVAGDGSQSVGWCSGRPSPFRRHGPRPGSAGSPDAPRRLPYASTKRRKLWLISI